MKRPSLLLCAASLAVAGVLLNCGDDDEGRVTPSLEAGPGADSSTSRPDTSTPTPDSGGDGGSDAGPTGRTVYGIDDANQLVMFTTGAPGTVTKVAVTGLAGGETIHGIDFRPKDGTLYALGSTGKVYLIAPATGVATGLMGDAGAVVTVPLVLDPTATSFGFDFNPPADRIRVHTNTGKNYRLHPADGNAVNAGDPDLAYVDGGAAASIVGTAYTNSVSAQPVATQLFGIDPALDQLVTFSGAPGFADVAAVGPLGVDAEDVAGFDIFGGNGGGDGGAPAVATPLEAYAALRVAGATNLYKIDLTTGTATLAGAVGHDKALRGIAVQP